MRISCTHLYVHFVWATWDRLPMITPEVRPGLYAALAEKCRELKCTPLEIGGIEDHVHMLVRLHSTVAVATLAQEAKGSTSHLITHAIAPGSGFKWQGAYGAFSIGTHDLSRIRRYIERQAEHHARGDLCSEWEQTHETEESQASGVTR